MSPPRTHAAPSPAPAPGGVPALEIDIVSDSPDWGRLRSRRRLVSEAVAAGLAVAPATPMAGAELSILLTGDARMREINREWRGFDKPTNVLSFPAVPAAAVPTAPALGDIVLAFETVAREAEEEGKPLAHHVSHLVIHGLLHLLGDDHETEAEAQAMEAREIAALARLGLPDPYRHAQPQPDAA